MHLNFVAGGERVDNDKKRGGTCGYRYICIFLAVLNSPTLQASLSFLALFFYGW